MDKRFKPTDHLSLIFLAQIIFLQQGQAWAAASCQNPKTYSPLIITQNYNQGPVLTYPEYSQNTGGYEVLYPTQEYNPNPTYPNYQNNQSQGSYNPESVQTYKRAPRMSYQDTGHPGNLNANFSGENNYYHPQPYQTLRRNNIQVPNKQFNKYDLRKKMLGIMMGGDGGSPGGSWGGNEANSWGANDAQSQRSIALSEADSAQACADRASYGSRSARQDAAYEARSHANRAQAAAQRADNSAAQGQGYAKNYAQDAWAAADRAQSAASRAQSAADRASSSW